MPLRRLPRFLEQYKRLPKAMQLKVDKALRLLGSDFRHPGLRSHPVRGTSGIYEAYVDDKYRMTLQQVQGRLFERRGDVIIIRNVDNHDECLKNP